MRSGIPKTLLALTLIVGILCVGCGKDDKVGTDTPDKGNISSEEKDKPIETDSAVLKLNGNSSQDDILTRLSEEEEFLTYVDSLCENSESYRLKGKTSLNLDIDEFEFIILAPERSSALSDEGSEAKLVGCPLYIRMFHDKGITQFNAMVWRSEEGLGWFKLQEPMYVTTPFLSLGGRYLTYPYTMTDDETSSFYIIDTKETGRNTIITPDDLAGMNGLELPGKVNEFVEGAIVYPDDLYPMYYYSTGEDDTAKTRITYIVRFEDGQLKMSISTPELQRKLGLSE